MKSKFVNEVYSNTVNKINGNVSSCLQLIVHLGLVAIAVFYLLILAVGLYAAWKNKKRPPDPNSAATAGSFGTAASLANGTSCSGGSLSNSGAESSGGSPWVDSSVTTSGGGKESGQKAAEEVMLANRR